LISLKKFGSNLPTKKKKQFKIQNSKFKIQKNVALLKNNFSKTKTSLHFCRIDLFPGIEWQSNFEF